MLVCSRWACDALARSDLDQASVMMVKRTEYGVVCPVARGNCGWPQMSHWHDAKTGNRPGSRGPAICSLPDFPEFAQAVRYGVPGTPPGSCAHEACVAGTDSQARLFAGSAHQPAALGKFSAQVDRILPTVIIGV